MATEGTLGRYFEQWKERHEQDDEQLAAYIAAPPAVLAALATERVPRSGGGVGFRGINQGYPDDPTPDIGILRHIAERYGANPDRFEHIVFRRFDDSEA